MATITDFEAKDEAGVPVKADAYGNNVALSCLKCNFPVLAIARDHQRGSSKQRAAVCRGCGSRYWISIAASERSIVVHCA